MIPGGKPVIAVPGLTPRSPESMLVPVLVTVEPPRTTKLPAVPRPGAVAAGGRADALFEMPARESNITSMMEMVRNFRVRMLFCLLRPNGKLLKFLIPLNLSNIFILV
jgi:hypothetical protein